MSYEVFELPTLRQVRNLPRMQLKSSHGTKELPLSKVLVCIHRRSSMLSVKYTPSQLTLQPFPANTAPVAALSDVREVA